MTPVQKGLVFGAIGIGVSLIMGLAVYWPLLGLSGGAAAGLTIALVVFAGLFGFLTGWKEVYALEPRPIWAFVIDVSWSALNTVTGLFWLIYCAAKGSFQTPVPETSKRGIIVFSGAALPGADASTIGTVMGGTWLVHEAVHVQQARIFGPFYWPVYLISYAANMLARFLTVRFSDPHWEAYGRVLMEDWAYRAAPASEIKVAPSVLWFLLTLVNALAVAVLVAPIPGVGALPDALGFDVLPWWLGLIVVFAYAIGRSFLPKADDPHAPAVFT